MNGWRASADSSGTAGRVGGEVNGSSLAMNSAVHSYLVLSYADNDKVAMNVGFYYMANAGGRLMGTVLSGALYQWHGLTGCLWASVIFVLAAGFLSFMLPSAPPTKAGRSKAVAASEVAPP